MRGFGIASTKEEFFLSKDTKKIHRDAEGLHSGKVLNFGNSTG